jgi:hypothetical protein
MGCPPTKPLGNVTTEFALELYEFFAMLFTYFYWNYVTAFGTY